LKGSLSLCGSGQPVWASFGERDTEVFRLDYSIRISKLQNLRETSKSLETAKSQFERDLNRKISWSLSEKEAHIVCPDPQRLPFKGSLLLHNLVGPGYPELPF